MEDQHETADGRASQGKPILAIKTNPQKEVQARSEGELVLKKKKAAFRKELTEGGERKVKPVGRNLKYLGEKRGRMIFVNLITRKKREGKRLEDAEESFLGGGRRGRFSQEVSYGGGKKH